MDIVRTLPFDDSNKICIAHHVTHTNEGRVTVSDGTTDDSDEMTPEGCYELKESLGLTDIKYQLLKNKFKNHIASLTRVKSVRESRKKE